MRCPDTAVFRPSPPLVARSLTRLPICSGKSHPGLYTQAQPAGSQLKSHRPRAGSSRGHLPRESLANWFRSSVGRHRHVGHAGGVCGLGRPGAAPSRVDVRSWERDCQRRDAKYATDSSIIRSCMTHRLEYKAMPVTDWSISYSRRITR